MTDTQRDGYLAAETDAFAEASAAAAAASGSNDRVARVLDTAEDLAARRLGEERARQYREQAEMAVTRGRSLYEQGRATLDEQLAAAPYRTVGLAALAGLVVGRLLTPKKKKVVYRKRA